MPFRSKLSYFIFGSLDDETVHITWNGEVVLRLKKKNIGPHGGSMAVQMRPNNKHRFKAGIVF